MTEQSKTQKASSVIKQLLQTGVGLYLVLLVVFYALYFVNGYEQLATHKFELLKFMSICFACVMVPFAIIYGILYLINGIAYKKSSLKKSFAERFLYEISLTDAAICDFTCVLLVSYFLSSYKEEALWGTAGWYMGLGTQLIMVGIYFFVSRFFDASRIYDFVCFLGAVSILFILWGLLNRFSIYPIEMAYSQPSFISSMGNINWFCGYYSVVFCIGAVLYFISDNIWVRLFGIGHALVALGLGAVEGSDSAFLSLAACYLILFVCSFTETKKMKRFLELVCAYGISCQILRIIDCCFPESLNMHNISIDIMLGNGTLLLLAVAAGLRIMVEIQDRKWNTTDREWIRHYKKLRTAVIWICAIVAFVFLFLLIKNTKKPGSIGFLSRYSLFTFSSTWGSNRAMTWQDGLMIFDSMSPIQKVFGVGPDCFAIHAYSQQDITMLFEQHYSGNRLTNAHNEMITMLVNLGVFGLLTFVITFVSAIVRLVRCRKAKPIALVFIISICSYLVHNQFSFQQILNTPYIYMMLGLAECMMRAMREPVNENAVERNEQRKSFRNIDKTDAST